MSIINALTLNITQTMRLSGNVYEAKQTWKEWVFATGHGINFIKYNPKTN